MSELRSFSVLGDSLWREARTVETRALHVIARLCEGHLLLVGVLLAAFRSGEWRIMPEFSSYYILLLTSSV